MKDKKGHVMGMFVLARGQGTSLCACARGYHTEKGKGVPALESNLRVCHLMPFNKVCLTCNS